MNCTTPTRRPWPSMRKARPNAAVDFPLPGPVWTISSPFSIVLPATSASCTALRFSILARWRAASVSSLLLIGVPSRPSAGRRRPARPVGARGHPLIEPSLQVAEPARERIVGHDPKPTSLLTTTRDCARGLHRQFKAPESLRPTSARQASDSRATASSNRPARPPRPAIPARVPARSSGASTVCQPSPRAIPMLGDPRRHFVIARFAVAT